MPLVELAACALVLGALEGGPISRILSVRPLVWLGGISYSLYVWQQLPIFELHYQHTLIALPIAIALALLSYRLIESPFRHPPKRAEPVPAASAARA